MKRHRVSKLFLGEISSVDRPAQVGAVSVLLKRGETSEVRLLKATFAEALNGNLLADKVQDVFWKAFDGFYAGKEAFRKALIDELASSGDGSTASADFTAWLTSLVDQCVGAAKQAGAASAGDLEKSFTTTLTKAAEDRYANQEHIMTIKTKADLTAAIAKAQADGDKVTVGEVAAIHKAATDLNADDLLPAAGTLAKSAGKAKNEADDEDEKTKAKMKQMVKRDALSADLRKHYDTLTTDEDRDAFLSKSAAEQTVALEKARGDDPVIYTTLDGIDIRKSADPTLLALAKRADQQSRDLAKANAATEEVTLTKRAQDDLGNVGGDLIGKKALLKAVDGITDTATRDAAVAVLKAANAGAAAIFRKSGSTAPGDTAPVTTADGHEMGEAEAELETMAKAKAKADGVTFEKAYSEVIQTEEGSQLYKRFVEGG